MKRARAHTHTHTHTCTHISYFTLFDGKNYHQSDNTVNIAVMWDRKSVFVYVGVCFERNKVCA